ncbi:120.7 kDa protein in NOF-FB transposable element [Triplophysa dalaica]|uniref:120.7 kDa protein in NOF-FB transposable element n=1 Tax=Triplophysa dalaica TaxID=1582913 RepID=UPI0024DFE4D6|nr:120.7 kDa protein in NOF-FB transposable element [Triplophysa dalaica]
MLSEKLGHISNCVLSFSYNKAIQCQSRKKLCPFWQGKASCKFPGCAQFNFSIFDEPAKDADCVLVKVEVSGQTDHSTGFTFRRRTSKSERKTLKEKLRQLTPMHLHTKTIAAADEQKLIEGNTNEVPPLTVLQKISSEKNLENRLDTNPFLDCIEIQNHQDLNLNFSPLQHQYIQFVAMSPFITHMYSVDQLQLLKDFQKEGKLFLYLDATGTVVAKPKDCKSILYYALCCPVISTTETTVVAVAEMLSSDQSTPTIQHWLTCLSRDYCKMFRQHLHPQKVETDFSWAIIHACIQAFCQIDVHTYLQRCLQVTEGKIKCSFTVVHICAAHMIKILCCKVSKVKCGKPTKDLFLYSMALLQNATTLNEIKALLTDIGTVFSEATHTNCQESINNLKTAIENQSIIADVETEITPTEEADLFTDTTPKTIRHDSPFVRCFEDVLSGTTRKRQTRKAFVAPPNPYYCPGLIDIVSRYLATLPLWTGIMLNQLGRTRDTNSEAENWFRTTKTIVLKNQLHRRPGDFIQTMQEFISGRVRGVKITKIRQGVLKNKELTEIDQPLSQEEKWGKKRQKKKKSKYFNSPKAQKPTKGSFTSPPWAAHGKLGQQSIKLTNTCTIDNLLYILYLAMKTRPFILAEVEQIKTKDRWMSTLLEVFRHFLVGQWSQGKISWLQNIDRFQGNRMWNAFGTEHDFVVSRLDYIHSSERMSVCNNKKCPSPQLQNSCWNVAILCDDFSDLQQSMDNWVDDSRSFPCRQKHRNRKACPGRRTLHIQEVHSWSTLFCDHGC